MPGGGRRFGRGGQGRSGRGARWEGQVPRSDHRGGIDQWAWKDRPVSSSSSPCGTNPQDSIPNSANSVPTELDELKTLVQTMEQQLSAISSRLKMMEMHSSHPVFVVDNTLCTRCGVCVSVCPNDAIVIEETTVRINQDKCSGCGLCVPPCRFHAIRMA